MINCEICKKELAANILQVCLKCIRNNFDKSKIYIKEAFEKTLKPYNLPIFPPTKGVKCYNCSNNCKIEEGKLGYCGLFTNKNNKLINLTKNKGLLTHYLDAHSTNCVAAFCCAGGTGSGYPKYAIKPGTEYGYYNLSIFMASCSMHCLFCQNYSYLELTKNLKPLITEDELLAGIEDDVTCLCFFGGCIVPQLPFTLKFIKLVREKAIKENRILRICSETNGLENNLGLKKFAELSLESGGGIKFDLKFFSEELSIALSGVSNKTAYKNFESLAEFNKKRKKPPFLRASTLLIPYYIDTEEINNIARFIASIDENIPYSLLGFYPAFMLNDLPVTTLKFAKECYSIAKKAGLKNVNIGNIHLLR